MSQGSDSETADDDRDGPWYLGKARDEFNKRQRGEAPADSADDDPVQASVLRYLLKFCYLIASLFSGLGIARPLRTNAMVNSDPMITTMPQQGEIGVTMTLTNSWKRCSWWCFASWCLLCFSYVGDG